MMLVAVVVVNLVIAAVLYVTPAISRADTPLGVRVPPDRADHPVVASATRSYRRATAVIGVTVALAGGIAATMLDAEPAAAIGLVVLPMVLIALSLVAMARARRAIVDVKRQEGWLADASGSGEDDDRHYRLGVFYVNPDDPSLLVDKRFGYGVDFNYGHPVGRVIGAFLALLMVGTVAGVVWLAFTAG